MTSRRGFERVGATVLSVALLLAGAAACGDDDEPATQPEPSTSTERSATTAPETTTTAAPACPPVAVPTNAQDVTEAIGDADGDGEGDELRTYRVGDEWHLQVELTAEGGHDLVIPTFGAPPEIIGGGDVDGDGRDEIWARVGSGASTTILALAQLRGCELAWVTFETGARAELPVGGSVGTVSGVECGSSVEPDADLTIHTSTLLGDGPDYEVLSVEHDLVDGRLIPVFSSAGTVDATTSEFNRYASFTCPDLHL